MDNQDAILVVGGTSGIGLAVATHYAALGRRVFVTSRDESRALAVAKSLGDSVTGLRLDLSDPGSIDLALSGVSAPLGGLVLGAVDSYFNTIRDFDIAGAVEISTIKLVGYPEVIHCLLDRLASDASLVLFGGLAKERPYFGSTMVSTVNDAMCGLVSSLARELGPMRVNGIHPGPVGDHPKWRDRPSDVLDGIVDRTPLGRLVTIEEVADAVVFLLEHPSVNAVNLFIDGGWMVT